METAHDQLRWRPRGAQDAFTSLAPHLPAALVLLAWLVWIPQDGGYFPRQWYPVAIGLVALLVVIVVAARGLPRAPAGRVALALLAGFVAWNYLSLLWTPALGGGWVAADKLLLYLLMATVVALGPWGPRSAVVLLGAWTAGVVALLAISLLQAANATSLAGVLVEFRYAKPIGYQNAVAAMAAIAFVPALMLASQRRAGPLTQAGFMSGAGFLLAFMLLPQTRAAGLALALALVAFFALAHDRTRAFVRLGIVVAIVGATCGPILDFYDVTHKGRGGQLSFAAAFDAAAPAVWRAALIAAVAGLALGLLDRWRAGRPGLTRATRAAVAIVALAAVGAAAVAVQASGGRSGSLSPTRLSPRLAVDYDEGRSDYWRVALDMARDAPVVGEGAASFYPRYTADRRLEKHSRYVHDIWLRALAENGALGLGLLVGFAAAVLGGMLLRRRFLETAAARNFTAATAAMLVYFLAHASVDWIDEFPALAGPALALPFAALALSARERAAPPALGRRTRIAAGAVAALAAATAFAALAFPYVAGRYVDRAFDRGGADPGAAFADLRRAADLNPASLDPPIAEGIIALAVGRPQRARAAFRRSIDVEDNWYAHFELALLDSQAGHVAAARREVARAAELDASDPVVTEAQRAIGHGERLSLERVNAALTEQNVARFGLARAQSGGG